MRSASPLHFLLAPIALLGCLDGAPVVGGNPPTNTCSTDRDCPDGRCDLTRRRCVANARTDVFFSVTPPAGRSRYDAFPTLTEPRSIRSGERLDIALRAPRTVYGSVLLPAATSATAPPGGEAPRGSPVAAAVEFSPSSLLDVVTPVRAVASSSVQSDLSPDGSAATWRAMLPAGSFDVVVRPASELAGRIPPLFQRGVEVRPDAEYQRLDLTYPARFTRWAGVIRDPRGVGLPGLSVRAVDPSRDAQVISTVVTTRSGAGEDPGAFAVDMAPGAPATWSLRISSDAATRGWLTVELPRSALDRLDPTGRALRIELPSDLGLPFVAGLRPSGGPPPDANAPPCVGCVEVRGTVEGRSLAGGVRTLRGASVTLRTTLPLPALGADVSAWFECRAETDADGGFQVWAIPGLYDVTLSPAGGEFANTVRHGFVVRGDVRQQLGQVFSVDPRLPLEGRVLTPGGAPVRGARVTAIPFHDAYVRHSCLDDPELRSLASRATTTEGSTGSDGSYRLDLDPGLYRVLIEPPERSGYPATLGAAVCVASRVRAYDTVLDAPVELQGNVLDASGRPAPGAHVEAIVRLREPGAPGVVVRVAQVTAGDGGGYSLLLPGGATAAR